MPLLLSVAVQNAIRLGASTVVTGLSRRIDATHLGLLGTDGRPDRLREFLHAYNGMLDTLRSPPAGVSIRAPLIDLTYAEIMQLALRFKVPLDKTRSCVQPDPKPCGHCDPCAARGRALEEANLDDSLIATTPA